MTTPRDDPRVLADWQELEEQLVAEGGSRHQAHLAIARRYGTTRDRVYYWLTPERQEYQKRYWQEYRQRPGVAERLREYHRAHSGNRSEAAPPTPPELEELSMVLPDLKRLFEEALRDEEELAADELWGRVSAISCRPPYRSLVDRVRQLLPVEESRPGVYRMKSVCPAVYKPATGEDRGPPD